MGRREQSFTLIELMIVVVIIGIIAGFAIPGYEKAITRQKVKRLILTANLIAGAQEIYKAKNGQYGCQAVCSSLADINSNLGINIMPEAGVNYLTWGMVDGSLLIRISDEVLFQVRAVSSPLNIVCTNLSATPVCP